MKITIKAATNKCKSCGDDLIYSPDKKCLYCISCKSTFDVNSKTGLPKHNFDEAKELTTHKNSEWLNQNKSLQCPNCGAKTILTGFQKSSTCAYCDTSLISIDSNNEGIKPDSIIPFVFGTEKAEEIFKTKIKQKWFVSNKFKNTISTDEIHAYYFPAFIYDASCNTSYEGKLYENYDETDSSGNTNSKRKYFDINGQILTTHQNIAIEASTRLSQYELNSIKPYNFNEAKTYIDEYVYGYSLECYSNSLNETKNQAETIIKADIKKDILRKYDHDGVDYLKMNTEFTHLKYSYCLLPMYRINYSHKNKKYSNIMNGQTGSLTGDYPKSALKISLVVILALLLFGIPLIAFIVSFL